VAVALACASASVQAEPGLANLLRPAPVQRDPLAELAQQLAALERRPYAADPAVQQALARVHAELAQLRLVVARAADAAQRARRTALVWAALSWADRLEARAKIAAAMAGLAARADAAEASVVRERAQAAEATP
jgi:alkylation response protein AidB-like acyl-CoA dehydrogenase